MSAIAFPPLPPLPPFPARDANHRRSAPPSTLASSSSSASTSTAAAGSSDAPARVRSRRSRVSFRDDVDVADTDRPSSRSGSSVHAPSPSAAHRALPTLPPALIARRPSADGDAAVTKATMRPALKRAASCLTARSSSSLVSLSDDFDAFRPQTLRYPKVSPALARLSDGSIPAPRIWAASNTNSAMTSTSARKPLTARPPTAPATVSPSLSPAASSSGQGSVSAGASPVASSASASGSAGSAPPARKARKPRSPIPSWGSTCPSLSSSSHRASVASTLTAPSMTSLILSPPSPIERHMPQMMPSYPYPDSPGSIYTRSLALGRDADDIPDVPDLPEFVDAFQHKRPFLAHSLPLGHADTPDDAEVLDTTIEHNTTNTTTTTTTATTIHTVPAKSRLHHSAGAPPTNSRILRPRKSCDPALLSSSSSTPSECPPTSFHAPRATERLLKLQNSLADLRMQRRASPDKLERDYRASSTSASSSGIESRVSSASPSSPAGRPSRLERPSRTGHRPPALSLASPTTTPRSCGSPNTLRASPTTSHASPTTSRASGTVSRASGTVSRASGTTSRTSGRDSPATARSRASPPSPTMAELARQTPRRYSSRSRSKGPLDASEDDDDYESDLDLSLPLLNAALRSHVIPSTSRLLTASEKRAALEAEAAGGEVVSGGLGWSGSESEEEEFSRTVARIALRKSTMGASASTLPTRGLMKRPSLPATRMKRFSEFSPSSDSSVSGPPTPSVCGRPSTAQGNMRPNGTAALLSALEQKYASREALPRPRRFVEGWGAPEVLPDDDWPLDDLHEDGGESEILAAPGSAKLPPPLGEEW